MYRYIYIYIYIYQKLNYWMMNSIVWSMLPKYDHFTRQFHSFIYLFIFYSLFSEERMVPKENCFNYLLQG